MVRGEPLRPPPEGWSSPPGPPKIQTCKQKCGVLKPKSTAQGIQSCGALHGPGPASWREDSKKRGGVVAVDPANAMVAHDKDYRILILPVEDCGPNWRTAGRSRARPAISTGMSTSLRGRTGRNKLSIKSGQNAQ